MKNPLKIASICWLTAAVCFAIVSAVNFFRGSNGLALVTLVLCLADLLLLLFSRKKAAQDSNNN